MPFEIAIAWLGTPATRSRHTALNAGSSKHGNRRRASAASNCVTAMLPARYSPRSPGLKAPRYEMRTLTAPAGSSSANASVRVSLTASAVACAAISRPPTSAAADVTSRPTP